MFTKTKVRAPTVGDLVLFEGLRHRIRMFVADKVEFVSERLITVDVMRADGTRVMLFAGPAQARKAGMRPCKV